MSIECGECERDLRGGHDETCSRHPKNVAANDTKPAGAQSRAGEAGANLTDVLCAFRDITYALQELSNALAPHGHEREINTLLVSAHNAIDRAAHNV